MLILFLAGQCLPLEMSFFLSAGPWRNGLTSNRPLKYSPLLIACRAMAERAHLRFDTAALSMMEPHAVDNLMLVSGWRFTIVIYIHRSLVITHSHCIARYT